MKRDYVIVGGGVIGLSIAYYLLRKDPNLKVTVFEKKYVGYGASTRNGSHIRVHFWSRENAVFAVRSRRLMMKLASELGWNPILILGGYLWLIFEDETLKAYEDMNRRLWSRLGVPVEFLDKREVEERFPYLNVDGLKAGVLGPQDGKIHHDFVTLGYYHGVRERGGEILEYTPVDKIVVEENFVRGVETLSKTIEADNVIVAAGAWSKNIFSDIGIKLPLTPARKEQGVMEPTKLFINPLIIDMRPSSQGLYICQTPRGEVMGSVDYPEVKNKYEFTNTMKYLSTFARHAINLIPALRHLSFLRIWSGDYNMTPDHSHILGRGGDWPEGLYIATGFSGHGFMMSPYVGVTMADYLIDGVKDEIMDAYSPDRFKTEKLIHEAMVIG